MTHKNQKYTSLLAPDHRYPQLASSIGTLGRSEQCTKRMVVRAASACIVLVNSYSSHSEVAAES